MSDAAETAASGPSAPAREIRGIVVTYRGLTAAQRQRLISMAREGHLAYLGVGALRVVEYDASGSATSTARVNGTAVHQPTADQRRIGQLATERMVRRALAAGPTLATGSAKSAAATVWIKDGTGSIRVNRRPFEEYFRNVGERWPIQTTLESLGVRGAVDLFIRVSGGGKMGQSKATNLALAKAVAKLRPSLGEAIRTGGMRTRDSRMKERKKFGRKGARKRFQFSKR